MVVAAAVWLGEHLALGVNRRERVLMIVALGIGEEGVDVRLGRARCERVDKRPARRRRGFAAPDGASRVTGERERVGRGRCAVVGRGLHRDSGEERRKEER